MQRKWHEVSVDVDEVIGTKRLSVNGYQKKHNVFVDLYLTSGATIQIALDFTDEQKARVEKECGPKPDEAGFQALYQLVGEKPPKRRFLESHESYKIRMQPWRDRYWAWNKARSEYYRECDKYYNKANALFEVLGQEVYADFVKDLNLVTDSPETPQDPS